MRIEAYPSSTPEVKLSISNSSWEAFFSHFPQELSNAEKNEMIEHFINHLSHLINHQMRRMLDVYKKMREEL